MAIGGVVIQFALDTADAVRNLTKFTRETSKIETELDGVDRALDESGREFDHLAADVDQMVRRVKTDMSQMGTAVDTGAQDVDGATSRMRQDMGEAGTEAGAEFISNIAEGIGSGTANVNDVVTGTLGGLTNLAATMTGPVGIAAAAASAGIGLVFAAVTGAQKKSQEAIDETVTALVGLGETSSDAAKKLIWDNWLATLDAGGQEIGDIRDGLEAAGVPAGVFQDAMTGSETAAQQVKTALDKQMVPAEDMTGEQYAQLENYRKIYAALGLTETQLDTANTTLGDLEYLTGETADGAKGVADEYERAADEAGNTRDNVDDIPDNKTVDVNVKYHGQPPPGARGGGGAWGGGGNLSAPATMAAPLAAPVTVNFYASGMGVPDSPRALIALLESHDVRMGRRPGQPRAVAW